MTIVRQNRQTRSTGKSVDLAFTMLPAPGGVSVVGDQNEDDLNSVDIAGSASAVRAVDGWVGGCPGVRGGVMWFSGAIFGMGGLHPRQIRRQTKALTQIGMKIGDG